MSVAALESITASLQTDGKKDSAFVYASIAGPFFPHARLRQLHCCCALFIRSTDD
jgi:hypothetical protein